MTLLSGRSIRSKSSSRSNPLLHPPRRGEDRGEGLNALNDLNVLNVTRQSLRSEDLDCRPLSLVNNAV
jgi:hypothetical protein